MAECGELEQALSLYGFGLLFHVRQETWEDVATELQSIGTILLSQNYLYRAQRLSDMAINVAELDDNEEGLFLGRLRIFVIQSRIGQWAKADASWRLLDPMGRDWSRVKYRPGRAELSYAQRRYWGGVLREKHLSRGASDWRGKARTGMTFELFIDFGEVGDSTKRSGILRR